MSVVPNTGRASRRSLTVAGVLSALVLAGCSDSAGGSQNTASDSEIKSGLEEAEAKVAAAVSGDNFMEPPTDGPKPAKDKTVWMVNVGLGSAGTVRWADGFEEAAAEMGWNATVFDGEFTPSKGVEGIQQAIAAGVDGIVLAAIDCAAAKAPLEQAKEAGIEVVGLSSADCSDVDSSAPSLYDGAVRYAPGGLKELSQSLGAQQADWITVATEGQGKIISVTYNESVQNNWQVDGFETELETVCPGCEIVDEVDFVAGDLLGTGVREKIEQTLLKNPDADGLVVPFDDVMTTSGGSAAVNQAGRNSIQVVATGGAAPAAFEEVREGTGVDAFSALSFEWEAWAAIDGLNRLFAGEPVANSGLAGLLVDEGHNDESTTGYDDPPIEFRAAYRKAWGIG